MLQALALRMRDDARAALPPLERALALAEPEGYVRMFVDEGPAMASLLDAAEQQGIARDYVRRLQNALERNGATNPDSAGSGRPAEPT